MASVRLREIRKSFRDTQILHGVSLQGYSHLRDGIECQILAVD